MIDHEARAALESAGLRLVGQLDAMRTEADAAEAAGEALDPEAQLALRKRGDSFLEELELQRQAVQAAQSAKKWRKRFVQVAAMIVLSFALVKLSAPPVADKPAPELAAKSDTPAPLGGLPIDGASAAVPEPGTGGLAVFGTVMLALRRRRPA